MLYNSELAKKNMKFLRKIYRESQAELAKVMNCTQNAISNYETGERDLSYENIQMLANHFRIPVEQFVKDDLSDIAVVNLLTDVNLIYKFYDEMFPIFCSSKALKDEYFVKGYNDIVDLKKEKYYTIERLEACIEYFVQSYNKYQTIESVANVLGFVLLFYAPIFDAEKQKIGRTICEKSILNKEIIKKCFLRTSIIDDFSKKKFNEENDEFILECIQVLKQSSEWSELGDYYLALKYLLGVVDNEHNVDVNIMIGEEMMYALVEIKNKYASAFYEKRLKLYNIEE